MQVEPLWADLINSDWHDHRGSGRREDRLLDDRWLRRFLERAGWRGRLPVERGRARLRSLRGVLRRTVDRLRAGVPPAGRDLAALNRRLAAAPEARRLVLAGGRTAMVRLPAARGIDGVLGAVAASFAELLVHGDPRRVKACANPACGWVIYDESRNRTRRWCEAEVCGSLVRVRRFRRRSR